MITVHGWCCQTLRACAFAGLIWLANGRALAGNEPPSAPPAWQHDLDAARLLEGALAVTAAPGPTDEKARRERLQDLYGQLARKYPSKAAVQKAAADYLSRDGQPTVALPFWERAARLNPCDGDTADRLGGEFLRLGRTRDAYAQFERAVEVEPGSAAYHSDLANVLYLFRQDLVSPPVAGLPDADAALAQALAHFRRASQLAPQDLRLAQAYAETFYVFARPDWPQALAAWEAVLALSGENGDFANSHLARISLRQGRPDAATDYLLRMHDPAFAGLKLKLQKQADKQRAATPPR